MISSDEAKPGTSCDVCTWYNRFTLIGCPHQLCALVVRLVSYSSMTVLTYFLLCAVMRIRDNQFRCATKINSFRLWDLSRGKISPQNVTITASVARKAARAAYAGHVPRQQCKAAYDKRAAWCYLFVVQLRAPTVPRQCHRRPLVLRCRACRRHSQQKESLWSLD